MLLPYNDINWIDFIDIFLVAFLFYQLYTIVKGTAAIRILLGIMAIYLFWKLVEALNMVLLSEILGKFISVGVIALIIVFQQEIRRFLLLIGSQGFFKSSKTFKRVFRWQNASRKEENLLSFPLIVKACKNMAEQKTGALIVLQKDSNLQYLIHGGVRLDAKVSHRLIESIFFKNSPLHDGAVIISNNKIKIARGILPLTEKEDFPSQLGMRHRAAVGITEKTDAIAIVVSEQNGEIAYAQEGKLKNNLSSDELLEKLNSEFQ